MWWVMTAALAAPWGVLNNTDGWEDWGRKSSDVGDVAVRYKEIDGLRCIEGRTVVPEAPASLLRVAMDIESATRWSSQGLVASRTLVKSPDRVDYYQYLDVPNWTLVADRYWLLRGRVVREGAKTLFRWERVEDAAYADAHAEAKERSTSAIEPPVNWGEWMFNPTEAGTDVAYRACVDVGGSIPDGIAQWVAKRTLPGTIADLVLEARQGGG